MPLLVFPEISQNSRRGLGNKADAVYLIEACLRGKLLYVRRRPRDGEAAISGSVFVWEANSAGIDYWRDGMEWTVQGEDGFEVGEAIDGSWAHEEDNQHPCLRWAG